MYAEDMIVSIFLFIIAIVVAVDSLRLGIVGTKDIGDGLVPLILAIILVVLSTVTFVSAAGVRGRQGARPDWPDKPTIRRICYIVILTFLYNLVMVPLGFLTSTALYTMFTVKTLGASKWWLSAFIGIVTTGVFFVVFRELMSLNLPLGLLEGR